MSLRPVGQNPISKKVTEKARLLAEGTVALKCICPLTSTSQPGVRNQLAVGCRCQCPLGWSQYGVQPFLSLSSLSRAFLFPQFSPVYAAFFSSEGTYFRVVLPPPQITQELADIYLLISPCHLLLAEETPITGMWALTSVLTFPCLLSHSFTSEDTATSFILKSYAENPI